LLTELIDPQPVTGNDGESNREQDFR